MSTKTLSFFVTIAWAVGIGLPVGIGYIPIHYKFFSWLPETEVFFYGAWVFLFLLGLTLWYSIFLPLKRKRFRKILQKYSFFIQHLHPRIISVILLFTGGLYCLMGFLYLTFGHRMDQQFKQMGISIRSFPAVPIVISILIIAFVLHRLSVRSFNNRLKLPSIITTIIVILGLTFYVGTMSVFDFAFFAGPVHDLLMGRPPLTFTSWYGFLSILWLSFIFKVIPLTLFNLYIVFAVIGAIGFIFFFLFASFLFKDYRWAMLAAGIGIVSNFLVHFGKEPNLYPSTTFFRFGMWLPVAYALLYGENRKNVRWYKLHFWITPLTVCLAFYWNADIGLYIFGAYVITIWFISLSTDIKTSIRQFIGKILPTLLLILMVFIGITVGYRLFFRMSPDWSTYWMLAFSFLSLPYVLHPTVLSVIPWAIIAVPVITLSTVLSHPKDTKGKNSEDTLMIFLSSFSIISFTYFMTTSHFNAFHHICLPFVLCGLYLIRRFCQFLDKKNPMVGLAGCIFIACILVVPLYPLIKQAIANYRLKNIITTIRMIRKPYNTEFDYFGNTAMEVKRLYGQALQTNDFAIISPYDTWYLILWNVRNPLGINCLLGYWTQQAVLPIRKNLEESQVRFVFATKDRTGYNIRVSWIFTEDIQKKYRLINQIKELEIWERI